MTWRIAYWQENDSNPYQRLFYRALEPYGIETVRGLTISDDVLRAMRPRIDAIHFHWPEYIWRINIRNEIDRARRVAGFWQFLRECRRLHLPILWTVHNLRPHEAGWVDRFGTMALGRYSDVIIAHSDTIARELKRYGKQVVVMPHGNYDGIYPAPRDREVVLTEIGLSPLLPTLVVAGGLRGYKGVAHAVDATARFNGRVQLIVAGQPQEQFDVAALEARSLNNPWLKVLARTLPPQEFVDVIHAGTAVLLPYVRVTTSGALLSAWTLARGVVCSPEPYFTKLLAEHPGAGVIAASLSAEDFARAIARFLERPETERSRAAREAADAYSWANCVVPVAAALKTLAEQTARPD